MDRGAWWATVHKVTKSQTQLKRLNTHTHTHTHAHTHTMIHVNVLFLFSRIVLSNYLQPKDYSMPVSPPSLSPGCSDSYPLSDDSNHLILCRPLLLLPSIFPTRVFSNFTSGSQNIGTSASESVLPMNIQG